MNLTCSRIYLPVIGGEFGLFESLEPDEMERIIRSMEFVFYLQEGNPGITYPLPGRRGNSSLLLQNQEIPGRGLFTARNQTDYS